MPTVETRDEQRQRLIKKYKQIKEVKKRLPTRYDFTNEENELIKFHFSSVLTLGQLLGDEPIHGNVWIPDDIFITEINELAKKLGYPPHSSDYPRATSAKNRFHASWEGVIHRCGIVADYAKHDGHTSTISKQEVIYRTLKAVKQYNKPYMPEWQFLSKSNVPLMSIFDYWDGLTEFRKELCIPSKKEYYRAKNEKIMISVIQNMLQNKIPITISAISQHSVVTREKIFSILRHKYNTTNPNGVSYEVLLTQYIQDMEEQPPETEGAR